MSETEAAEAGPGPTDTSVTTPPPESAEPDVESRARRMGWKPKEEFRGPESNWTDASTFVERGEAALPVLRERYRALDDRAARQEQQLGELAGRVGEFQTRIAEATSVITDLRNLNQRAEERAYNRARTEYESKMALAVETADRAAFAMAKAQLDALDQDRRQAIQTAPPAAPVVAPPIAIQPKPPDPVVSTWLAENSWFNTDGRGDVGMTAYASARDAQLAMEFPGMDKRERLDQVRQEVVQRFPDKFSSTRRPGAPAVSAPSAPSGRRKGKSFDELPAEAKAAYGRAKKWMPDYKPEEYVKSYFAGDEE